ncbi:MAG: hypothetical protein KGZ63_06820 [Clostridiales bacterium]|nr:hypothetical protein [Clostridiales bacterium]
MRKQTDKSPFISLTAMIFVLTLLFFYVTVYASIPAIPHDFNKNQDSCRNCHSPHRGTGIRLMTESTVEETCLVCHDGTRASMVKYQGESVHYFADENLSCNTCHLVHPPYNYRPLLQEQYTLETVDNDVYGEYPLGGYTQCLDCHSTGSGYENAADINTFYTGTAEGVDGGHFLKSSGGLKPSGWKLSCSHCHSPHASENAALIKEYLGVMDDEIINNAVFYTRPVEDINYKYEQRQFCLTCHSYGITILGVSVQNLPAGVENHYETEPSRYCSDCHSRTPGNNFLEGIHAPCVPKLLLVSTYVNDDAEIEAFAFTGDVTPLSERDVVFAVVYGSGTLYRDSSLSIQLTPGEPVQTGVDGKALVWLQGSETVTVEAVCEGLTKSISITFD